LIDDAKTLTEKVVSQVIDGFELFVPLGYLVDFEQEIKRLEGELKSVESEIARANGKLSNQGFLEKAPKALVDSEHAKLDKYIDMRSKIVAQLKDLKG
jgi:valyl-tRNA synthetase